MIPVIHAGPHGAISAFARWRELLNDWLDACMEGSVKMYKTGQVQKLPAKTSVSVHDYSGNNQCCFSS